jgi:2-polyprenyl-3-methyl-5-hydroxy-6-metoxy-1,4-benzoquinol methylase
MVKARSARFPFANGNDKIFIPCSALIHDRRVNITASQKVTKPQRAISDLKMVQLPVAMMGLSTIFKSARNRFLRWRKGRSWERQWRKPDFRPSWLSDTPRPFVISGLEKGWWSPGMTVLEIGCGLGTAAAWLAQRGLQVVAIDVSSHVIKQARKAYPNQRGLEFRQADACAPTNISTVFDIIIDTGCLQHIPTSIRDCYCQNLLAWSRTGSRFVVTMHKKDRSASQRLSEVQALFSANFDLVSTEEVRPADERVNHLNSVFYFVRR